MSLQSLLRAVREESLTREQLESYRDEMSHLFAEYQIRMASLEKEEALFMNQKGQDESIASVKVRWKASASGQELIVLKRESLALKELLNSLKSRIYQLIY